MTKIILFLLVILTSVSLISCSSSDDKNSASKTSLTNTQWVLTEMNDLKIFTPEGGKKISLTLTKEGNKVNGSGGCNNYFTTFTQTGNELKFGAVASTEMFCQGIMETEGQYFKTLEKVQSYKIEGNVLNLSAGGKVFAKFESVNLK